MPQLVFHGHDVFLMGPDGAAERLTRSAKARAILTLSGVEVGNGYELHGVRRRLSSGTRRTR